MWNNESHNSAAAFWREVNLYINCTFLVIGVREPNKTYDFLSSGEDAHHTLVAQQKQRSAITQREVDECAVMCEAKRDIIVLSVSAKKWLIQ